jgi:hypothetical protein
MRAKFAFAALAVLGACAEKPAPPNPFPEADRMAFMQMCRGGEEFCKCSWDGITRAMTAEEWAKAQTDLETTGHPHPQIVIVSSRCREH